MPTAWYPSVSVKVLYMYIVCVFVPVYVYVYEYYIYTHTHMNTIHGCEEHFTCFETHSLVIRRMYMCVCMFVYLQECMHTYIHTYSDGKQTVSMCSAETHTQTYIHTYIYIHTCSDGKQAVSTSSPETHTHTYTHTYVQWWQASSEHKQRRDSDLGPHLVVSTKPEEKFRARLESLFYKEWRLLNSVAEYVCACHVLPEHWQRTRFDSHRCAQRSVHVYVHVYLCLHVWKISWCHLSHDWEWCVSWPVCMSVHMYGFT